MIRRRFVIEVTVLVLLLAAGLAWAAGSSIFATDPVTGTHASVSATTPVGTEPGLYVRVVSTPSGSSGGTSSNFGTGGFPSSGTAIGVKDQLGQMASATVDNSGNLFVNCANCSGSGVSATDEASFTAGNSVVATGGGVYNDAIVGLLQGQQGGFRLTPNRAIHTNLRNQAGTELGTTSNPLQVTGANGSFPVSGTVSVNALPTGSNTIGAVTQASGPWTANVTQFGSSNVATGTGASGAGIPRVTVSNDSVVGIASNSVVNVFQFGSNPVVTGTGTSGSGIPRVTVSSDSSLAANQSINLAQVAGGTTGTSGTGIQKVGVVGNAGVALDAASGTSVPANAVQIAGMGSTFVRVPVVCDSFTPISATANTQIITGATGRQTYICAMNIVVGSATITNVALVEGTGTTCATNTAGIAGGTTSPTGWSFAANGGLAQGSGFGAIMRTATTGDNVCLLISATTLTNQVSGHISWTQQ